MEDKILVSNAMMETWLEGMDAALPADLKNVATATKTQERNAMMEIQIMVMPAVLPARIKLRTISVGTE